MTFKENALSFLKIKSYIGLHADKQWCIVSKKPLKYYKSHISCSVGLWDGFWHTKDYHLKQWQLMDSWIPKEWWIMLINQICGEFKYVVIGLLGHDLSN